MAFNTAEGRAEYTASSAQTEFTFTFKIYTTSDIKVYQTPSGDTPNDTTDILTLTTDYTVSINGDNGGTVTLNTGAGTGDTIVLVRSLPLTRTTDYQDNGDLLASTLDTDQNYQTYLIIDTHKQIERTLSLPDSTVGVSLELPSPLADGYLKWNADADAIENDTTIPDNVTLSQTAATTATTKASEATTSATNAQLRAWEAEAEKMTADSYATEAEDVFVKTYSSDGDGTFTATNTTEYSALHWAAKSQASAESASGITYDNSISGLTAINVQNAIDEIVAEKAPLASPAFSGTPTAPTVTAGTYTTQVATMEAVNSSIVQATAYTFTGTVTFKDFTGIPSWAKRITITLDNFSTSGSSNVLFQIGDAGGIENSGYAGSVAHLVHAVTPTVINFSTGFLLDSASDASNIRSGVSYLSLLTGNRWLFSSVCGRNSVAIEAAGGSKTLSATLDRLRITTAGGTDTIDAGSIVNISWEG